MAEQNGIDIDVKGFILEKVNSLEHLEILLLLYANPNQEWSKTDVSNKLRNSVTSAEQWLLELEREGLVTVRNDNSQMYRFNPKHRDIIEKVARMYTERRVSVLNLIFSKPLQRIHVFADAFKIVGKDKKEDG